MKIIQITERQEMIDLDRYYTAPWYKRQKEIINALKSKNVIA